MRSLVIVLIFVMTCFKHCDH